MCDSISCDWPCYSAWRTSKVPKSLSYLSSAMKAYFVLWLPSWWLFQTNSMRHMVWCWCSIGSRSCWNVLGNICKDYVLRMLSLRYGKLTLKSQSLGSLFLMNNGDLWFDQPFGQERHAASEWKHGQWWYHEMSWWNRDGSMLKEQMVWEFAELVDQSSGVQEQFEFFLSACCEISEVCNTQYVTLSMMFSQIEREIFLHTFHLWKVLCKSFERLFAQIASVTAYPIQNQPGSCWQLRPLDIACVINPLCWLL